MAVAVALSLLSCYTGTFFTVSGNNVYARGPFYGIHILVGYGYVGITSLHCLLRALRTDSYAQRWKYLSLFFFVVPALIFSSLQEVFSGCAFLCLGNTLGLLSVFVNSLEQRISLDPLTQLNNRLQMERYLQQRIAHYQGGNPRQLYLVLVDVNNFKKINDTYGHEMPVDVVKLDLRFLAGSENRKGQDIIQAVVQMMRRLQLPVIAEGVETAEQPAARLSRAFTIAGLFPHRNLKSGWGRIHKQAMRNQNKERKPMKPSIGKITIVFVLLLSLFTATAMAASLEDRKQELRDKTAVTLKKLYQKQPHAAVTYKKGQGLLLSVPIYHGANVRYVLYRHYSEEQIEKELQMSCYDGQGRTMLFTRGGYLPLTAAEWQPEDMDYLQALQASGVVDALKTSLYSKASAALYDNKSLAGRENFVFMRKILAGRRSMT